MKINSIAPYFINKNYSKPQNDFKKNAVNMGNSFEVDSFESKSSQKVALKNEALKLLFVSDDILQKSDEIKKEAGQIRKQAEAIQLKVINTKEKAELLFKKINREQIKENVILGHTYRMIDECNISRELRFTFTQDELYVIDYDYNARKAGMYTFDSKTGDLKHYFHNVNPANPGIIDWTLSFDGNDYMYDENAIKENKDEAESKKHFYFMDGRIAEYCEDYSRKVQCDEKSASKRYEYSHGIISKASFDYFKNNDGYNIGENYYYDELNSDFYMYDKNGISNDDNETIDERYVYLEGKLSGVSLGLKVDELSTAQEKLFIYDDDKPLRCLFDYIISDETEKTTVRNIVKLD